jgi:thiopeptide-type bacteriocin biosynthesis protein
MRSPLLSFDAYRKWCELGEVISLGDRDPRLTSPARGAMSRLPREVDDAAFREAIEVASPALHRELDAWRAGEAVTDAGRLADAVIRYFGRASFRPTPFGLFAGCSALDIGGPTRLELAARNEYSRHSRLDMDHVAELARVLSQDPIVRRAVPLRANPSVTELGGRLHCVETAYRGRVRSYSLTAVQPTDELRAVLALAREGTTYSALAASLLAQAFSEDEVHGFLGELLDAQLLVPDLEPLLTGDDATEALANDLERACVASEVSSALRLVLDNLRRVDAAGVGAAPNYDHAVAPLAGLSVPVDRARILQVDLYKPMVHGTINERIIDEFGAAADILAALNPRSDPLAAFAARFEERYEQREVPLLEALDDEIGIGFPSAQDDDGITRKFLEASRQRDMRLAELRCRSVSKGREPVELSDRDLESLRWPNGAPVPESLAVVGTIAARTIADVDRGDYSLIVSYVVGPSGARLLGRFAHLDARLNRGAKAHLALEESIHGDDVFAEIVHLPQGRTGNIAARPVLRTYEIPYLGRSGASRAHQIEVSDLTLSVRRGKVSMRSTTLGRIVHPRLSSAHNFTSDQQLPVYRFLCSLQSHGVTSVANWNWGTHSNASFLPRITRGRVIFSPATWTLDREEINTLLVAIREGETQVTAWRSARGIPRWVTLSEADNHLPADLSHADSTRALGHLLKGVSSAQLREMVPDPDQLCVVAPEGRFTHELLVPLIRRTEVATSIPTVATRVAAPRATDSRTRVYPPGSEWLFLKLYCGRGSGDLVVREIVEPLVREAHRQFPLKGWFFMRYRDPEFHVRLRFRTERANVPALMAFVGEAIEPSVQNARLSRLVYDTYRPEVERYGGMRAIPLAETLFHADSVAALRVLAAPDGGVPAAGDIDRAALMGVDRLFENAGLSLAERVDLIERVLGAVSSEVRRQRGAMFREQRAVIARALDDAANPIASDRTATALRARGRTATHVFDALRALSAAGELQQTLDDIIVSFTHMWVNRISKGAVAHELMVYDHLQRHYRGEIARVRDAKGIPDVLEAVR